MQANLSDQETAVVNLLATMSLQSIDDYDKACMWLSQIIDTHILTGLKGISHFSI